MGILMCLVVACSVPAFSLVFANLLTVLYNDEGRLQVGQKWAEALLAVATVGALATFLSHYLMERTAQAWVNILRMRAITHILSSRSSISLQTFAGL